MNGGNRLPILAAEIRRAHADMQEAAKTAAEHAITAGHALIEAKSLVKHGEWLPWLREHCELPERTAQLYMRIAGSGLKSATVADSGLKATAKMLASPKEKEEPEPVPMAVYLAESRPLEPEEIRIPIADVLPAPVPARRSTIYPEHIQRLARYLPYLPPIEINQHYEGIDYWHRLEAHKLAGAKTIVAIVTQVEGPWHHIRLFAMRNSRHGLPYTPEDEKHQDQLAEQASINLEAMREEASKDALAEWWRKRRAGEDEHGPSASYPPSAAGDAR